MKKLSALLCTLSLLLALIPAAYAAGPAGSLHTQVFDETTQSFRPGQEADQVNITLNDQPLDSDVPGLMISTDGLDARTLIPVRAIAEPLGAEVLWMEDTRQVLLFREEDTIVLTLGSAAALVNGRETELPGRVPAQILRTNGSDRTMVPLRFVSEQLDAQVVWDAETYTAAVTAELPQPEPAPDPEPQLPAGELTEITYDFSGRAVTLHLTAAPNYILTDLGDRVVVDLLGFTCEYDSLSLSDPVAHEVRSAPHGEGLHEGYEHVARVVLDLGEEASLDNNVQIQADMDGYTMRFVFRDSDPDRLPEPLPRPETRAFIVALDAGHGGKETGAIYEDILEKDITLPIALNVEKLLREAGVQVVMTRTSDQFVGLYERAGMANSAGADVFVSIHANASGTDRSFAGTFTYHYPVSKEGERLAKFVQKATVMAAGSRVRGTLSNNYVVVRETKMPACLVETGFMSNHDELMRLIDPVYQERLAQGIAQGILDYLDTIPVREAAAPPEAPAESPEAA